MFRKPDQLLCTRRCSIVGEARAYLVDNATSSRYALRSLELIDSSVNASGAVGR